MPDRRPRRLIAAASGLLVILALAGCAASGDGAARPGPATAAPAAASPSADTGKAAAPQDPVGADAGLLAPAAAAVVPVRVVIPSIGVDAALLDLARGADGVLAAPPANELDKAGWYAKGTVPGRVGPAVIAGHVDWVDRIAVFHRLGELKPGARISVVLSDRSTVRFTVDRVRAVSKFRFPTAEVYGPTPDAQLRVITCGGPWDAARDIYSQNLIVFATRAS